MIEAIYSNPPFLRSYWAVPGKILAGCYPGDLDPIQQETKIDGLIQAGVTQVINLMEVDETDHQGNPFIDYEPLLGEKSTKAGHKISVSRFDIPDMSIPTKERMRSILDAIQWELDDEGIVYIHCWGGKGRTGTVVGCWLIEAGLETSDSVLDRLNKLTEHAAMFFWPTPQTSEQEQFVTNWKRAP